MKAMMRVTNADDLQFSLTLTLPLKHWREISEQLSDKWPSWQLSTVINQAVRQITETVVADSEKQA